MHPAPLAVSVCFFSALSLPSQPPRVHPFLQQKIEAARPGDHLPAYAVVADRLGHDHWFPRVQGMPLQARRALVVAELQAHAARTQRSLLARLADHRARGAVDRVRSNWVGNLVRFRATPAALRDLAQLRDIEELRHDAAWPRGAVEDVVATPRGGVPGDGPVETRAVEVWALGYDGTGVVVMNADSGINVQHQDLAHRLWTNPGEIPGNGIDDDQNGFIDDVHGWNFFDDDSNIDDAGAHGTHTAGTLVGDGTCSGVVTGQAPGARVMTAALGPPTPQSGPFTPAGEAAQWDAVQYALQMGADVQTSSYSYKNGFVPPPNYKLHREVATNSLAAGLIRTNSTGNNGALHANATDPNRIPFNVSTPGNVPPPYLDPAQTLRGDKGGVLGVGAHDVQSQQLLSYSPRGPSAWHLQDVLAVNPAYPLANWSARHNDYPFFGGTRRGLIKPDLTGPTGTRTTSGAGVTCASTQQTGTSNATPRVAGTLVLWKQANPSLGPEDMAMIAHQSAAPSGTQPGKQSGWGAGRVDALGGLYLALCAHRVDGEPAWRVEHRAGTTVTLAVDTIPNRLTAIALGTQRQASGPLGLGGLVAVAYAGSSGPQGDAVFQAPVPAALVGQTVYSQCVTDDTGGATRRLLFSNVIATRIVP